jgi:hypothetical protein
LLPFTARTLGQAITKAFDDPGAVNADVYEGEALTEPLGNNGAIHWPGPPKSDALLAAGDLPVEKRRKLAQRLRAFASIEGAEASDEAVNLVSGDGVRYAIKRAGDRAAHQVPIPRVAIEIHAILVSDLTDDADKELAGAVSLLLQLLVQRAFGVRSFVAQLPGFNRWGRRYLKDAKQRHTKRKEMRALQSGTAVPELEVGLRASAVLDISLLALLPERLALTSAGITFAAPPLQVSLRGITADNIKAIDAAEAALLKRIAQKVNELAKQTASQASVRVLRDTNELHDRLATALEDNCAIMPWLTDELRVAMADIHRVLGEMVRSQAAQAAQAAGNGRVAARESRKEAARIQAVIDKQISTEQTVDIPGTTFLDPLPDRASDAVRRFVKSLPLCDFQHITQSLEAYGIQTVEQLEATLTYCTSQARARKRAERIGEIWLRSQHGRLSADEIDILEDALLGQAL